MLEATFESGFGSSRGLYEQADAGLGMTPGAYRRGGRGLQIQFTTIASAFGRVLVAATPKGVCAVLLHSNDTALEAELVEEFPNADIQREDKAVRRWAEPIVRYLEGAWEQPEVPLDLQGTDFQRRVWQALREIPYGQTRTYGDIAASIGRPSATRAVAQACGKNKVALAVPCHRVLRKGGALGGYRWGVHRKQRLLELEQSRKAG